MKIYERVQEVVDALYEKAGIEHTERVIYSVSVMPGIAGHETEVTLQASVNRTLLSEAVKMSEEAKIRKTFITTSGTPKVRWEEKVDDVRVVFEYVVM